MMRVKTGSNTYWIAVPLILLLALSFFLFATAVPKAAADDTIYLEADVTEGGELLPSSVVYTGVAYDFGFRLFRSTNRSYWERENDVELLGNFEILYYSVSDPDNAIPKPKAVGAYIARVTAKDVLSGYKNNGETSRLISEGVVVGEKRFSIVNEGLTLFCTPLDRVNALVLDDVHPADYFYTQVTTGVSLLLNGQSLSAGAGNDYTFVVQRHNGSAFVDTASISTVGTYRLKVTIKSTVDLSRTSAATVLDKSGDDYLLYREFSVTRATVSLGLTNTSMYEDAPTSVTLTDASKTRLSTTIGVSYNTQMVLLSEAGVGRIVASQNGGAVSYTPTEAGDYVYRVIFKSANAGYGVAVDDYMDLPFVVKKVPYTVVYFIDNSKSNRLNYEIVRSPSDTVSLTPVFYDLNGQEITSVATQTGQWKFTVSYKKYNSTPPAAWESATPMGAGLYRVFVTFTQDAEIESGYTISSGRVITREFQIITDGILTVTPYRGGVCYYTGSTVEPELLFLATGVADVPSKVEEKYVLSYFDLAGNSVPAPTAVGEYCFEVKFTSAVSELGVPVNAVYRGTFRIVYHTITVSFGDEILFDNGETGGAITPTPTYTVTYYKVEGDLKKPLGAAPTSAGSYMKVLTFTSAVSECRIAIGDFVIYEYSIAGIAARCEISTTALDLVYDGGVKEPTLSFTKGATTPLSLVEYLDYSVAYFKQSIPCGKPILAGNYTCLVTVLRTDNEKGLTRGTYVSSSFTIAPRTIEVAYSISPSSLDLVYDATNKSFIPRFTDGGHPVTCANAVEYAAYSNAPAYAAGAFKNAGKYLVRTTLSDDKDGSLYLNNATMEFTIEKLSLEVRFTVPLSYSSMWTGAEVSPTVKYVALNGRFADETERSSSAFNAFGVLIGENKTYFMSEDAVHYETPVGSPIKTGSYLQTVTTANANLRFYAASALGNNGSTVTMPTYTETTASQIFSIIPREVEVSVTYDAALYYTGSEAVDRKGVLSTTFKACNSTGTAYNASVVAHAFEAADYKIYYYPSDYSGVISGEGSLTKPTEKSYYVARILIERDGVNDTYLTDGNYTFKSGKNAVGGDLAGVAIYDGCYVDFVFRISDQNKLDVIYNMPATFAANGEGKAISLTFLNNFSEVGLIEGDGKDYKITYIDSEENEQATPYSETGSYRLKIKFLKTNIAYRLESYSGEYVKAEGASDLYIAENDMLLYDYVIFEPRELSVKLNEPTSLYYDGSAKNYTASFIVTEDKVDSNVTLTYGTHYKLVYYTLVDGKYESMLGAPSLPGKYAVEVAFQKDLLDYTIDVAGTPHVVTTTYFTTIKEAGGVYSDAKTPRVTFTLEKAILVLGGLQASDKAFDGTDKVTFVGAPTLSVKKEGGKDLGAMVKVDGIFPFTLSGEIKGNFLSVFPGESIGINVTSNYTLPSEADSLYDLEYPAYTAQISKSLVTVTPIDVTREYNPLAINSIINYSLTYDVDTMNVAFPSITAENMLLGSLSHEEGSNVGWYKIIKDTLAFDDSIEGVYPAKKLSDLFVLEIAEAGYRITERLITVALSEGQSKVYGDSDPKNASGEIEYAVTILSGSLIYGDRFVCTMTRTAGENVGTYAVTLSDARIVTKIGEIDVSANYRITLINGTFEIKKRRLKVSPKNQTATYLVGFDSFAIEVLDLDKNNRNVTEDYVTKPTGDRLSGKLATAATDDPLVFSILQGSITVVNASGKSVASNYDVDFDTSRTYTVERIEVNVRLVEHADGEWKIFGDKDPIIEFTISKTEKAKLGDLTLSDSSSIGRAPGEDVGEYNIYRESTPGEAGGFHVMDAGIEVSQFFKFVATNVVYGREKFTISPRPIIVTIEDETYENTGREILPVIKYLNENGSRLSASVLSKLKVNITVPAIDYNDGENLVTPVITGEVQSDDNFEITFKAGTITVIYLQNRVTATPLPETDEIYEGREYLFAGIMLYKTVKFYKLETANGEQPDRVVDISLPIDDTIKGEGLVAVALYADSAAHAFAFEQKGLTLVYSDSGAYYVAIAEVQEWFYVIWGVVLIASGVAIYFLTRLIVMLVRKHKEKQGKLPKKIKAAKKPKGVSAFAPNSSSPTAAGASIVSQGEGAGNETDDLFSSEAITSEPPASDASAQPSSDLFIPSGSSTDALFSDSAQPTSGEGFDEAMNFDIPDQDAFAAPLTIDEKEKEKAPDKKNKKKKEKEKEKEPKQKKKKGKETAPKGFVPSSFKPKGDKAGAYAPTRSYQEDLFIDEGTSADTDSLLSDAAITSDDTSIPIPPSPPSGDAKPGEDELIIARSSGFADDDPDDPNDDGASGGNGDML